MTRHAYLVLSSRCWQTTVHNKLQVALFGLEILLFLRCGDIKSNPGPQSSEITTGSRRWTALSSRIQGPAYIMILQNWYSSLEDSKYAWYWAFKCVFEPIKYLRSVTNRWHQMALSRFRLRVCGLSNQKRWFLNDNQHESCPSCKCDYKDKYLLFKCPAYQDKRKQCHLLCHFSLAPEATLVNILLIWQNNIQASWIYSKGHYCIQWCRH